VKASTDWKVGLLPAVFGNHRSKNHWK